MEAPKRSISLRIALRCSQPVARGGTRTNPLPFLCVLRWSLGGSSEAWWCSAAKVHVVHVGMRRTRVRVYVHE